MSETVTTTAEAGAPDPIGQAAPNPAEQAVNMDWTNGLPDDLKGYVTTKGFKDTASVVDSYKNLEKLIGVKEKLLQVPDDLSDAKSMENVWKRLGRPEKPEDYGIKGKDEAFSKWSAEQFHKLGLNANQAKELVKNYDDYVEGMYKAQEATQLAEAEKLTTDLRTKWGAAYDQNLAVAKNAASQFGIDSDMVSKMEQSLGFAKTMEFLVSVGSKIGEPDFSTGKGAANQIMTPTQAQAKIQELKMDKVWLDGYLNGGTQQRNELDRLNKMAVGQV
jgi:hypothetical protein